MKRAAKTIPSSARHRFHVFAFPVDADTSENLTAAIRKLSIEQRAIVTIQGITLKTHNDGEDDLIVVVDYWLPQTDETPTLKNPPL